MMLPDVAGARDRSLNVMTAAEEACEMQCSVVLPQIICHIHI